MLLFAPLSLQAFIAWLAEMAALPKPQRQVSWLSDWRSWASALSLSTKVNSSALRDILVDLCNAAATAPGRLRPEIVCLLRGGAMIHSWLQLRVPVK